MLRKLNSDLFSRDRADTTREGVESVRVTAFRERTRRGTESNEARLVVAPGAAKTERGEHGNRSLCGSLFRTRDAFTMTELAVWFAIVATLSVIGARTFQGMALEVRVKRAVREAAALLEWTRWETIRSGTVHRVEFDSREETLTVLSESREDSGKESGEVMRRMDLRDRFPGVVIGSAEKTCRTSGPRQVDADGVHLVGDTLRFHPSGTVDRAGSIYFMPEADLPDQRDRMYALSVLLAAGRVQLWRFDPWQESRCSGEGGWVPLY